MSKNRDILDQERKHFVQGCLRNGYDETSAEKIYDLIVRFANYGFNRSHAVAYSMIGYQLAYLKANYTLEFMTALLSSAIEMKIRLYSIYEKRSGKVFTFCHRLFRGVATTSNRRECDTLQFTFDPKYWNGYSDGIIRRTREKCSKIYLNFVFVCRQSS